MAFKGMDPDAGRTVAESIAKASESTQELIDDLTTLIGGVEWIGPDYDSYVADWNTFISSSVSPLIDAYNTMSRDLTAQADEQDTTSNAG